MKTREEMIAVLTRDEIQFVADNPFSEHIKDIAEFFTEGGFHAYSDEQLNEVYSLRHGDYDENETE